MSGDFCSLLCCLSSEDYGFPCFRSQALGILITPLPCVYKSHGLQWRQPASSSLVPKGLATPACLSKDVEWAPARIPGFGGNATLCPQDASLAVCLWMNLLCVGWFLVLKLLKGSSVELGVWGAVRVLLSEPTETSCTLVGPHLFSHVFPCFVLSCCSPLPTTSASPHPVPL